MTATIPNEPPLLSGEAAREFLAHGRNATATTIPCSDCSGVGAEGKVLGFEVLGCKG